MGSFFLFLERFSLFFCSRQIWEMCTFPGFLHPFLIRRGHSCGFVKPSMPFCRHLRPFCQSPVNNPSAGFFPSLKKKIAIFIVLISVRILSHLSTKTQIILNRCCEFLLISAHGLLWTYLRVNIKKKICKKDKIISCDRMNERGILKSRYRRKFLECIYIL